MKMTHKKALTAPAVALVAVAAFLTANVSASAQAELTNGPNGDQPNTLRFKPHGTRRPLTVRATPYVAPAPAPAPVANPVYGLGTVVATPFTILGSAFGGGKTYRKGGVTDVRYAYAGEEKDKIDEGFATPVPVDRSGPIYVVENGDPTISPLTFIGAPISAVGTIVQVPFHILGAPLGGAY